MGGTIKPDEHLVRKNIRDFYGYMPGHIYEVSGGSVGYTYSVDDRYFLKIYDTTLVLTARCTEKLQEQLMVLDRLRQCSSMKDSICYPVKTAGGDYFYTCGNLIGVLYNFIPGEAVGYERGLSEEETGQLAVMVRSLHGIDSRLFAGLCPEEKYDLSFCSELRCLLREKTAGLPERFEAVALEYRDVAEKRIREAEEMAERLKQEKLPFVLCHTDIHGGNIMRDPKGKLYLVDWENVLLAPKEADLFSFYEEPYFSLFADSFHEEAMRYYIIRRDLEDIWEFLNNLLHGEYGMPEQDEVFGHVKRIFRHMCL